MLMLVNTDQQCGWIMIAALCSLLQELTFDPRKEADVALKYRATITGAWTTFQPDVVAALSAHHILGPDFLEK